MLTFFLQTLGVPAISVFNNSFNNTTIVNSSVAAKCWPDSAETIFSSRSTWCDSEDYDRVVMADFPTSGAWPELGLGLPDKAYLAALPGCTPCPGLSLTLTLTLP